MHVPNCQINWLNPSIVSCGIFRDFSSHRSNPRSSIAEDPPTRECFARFSSHGRQTVVRWAKKEKRAHSMGKINGPNRVENVRGCGMLFVGI